MNDILIGLAERVRQAAAAKAILRIRGGATKQSMAGVISDAATLDMRSYAGIVDYAPSELVITARAGTPLVEIEKVLAERGQCLPFDPPRFADADGRLSGTVGGMVASGLAGPGRAAAGGVRDYVLGVQLVNGRGEAMVFGGQVMKNVAGYDVSRLMAGAMGTLGLIVEVSLKVLPRAPAEATLRFEMPQAQALERLNAWGGKPLPLNASCWVEEAGAGTLYLRLRGAQAAVQAASRTLGGELQPDAAAEWTQCREQQLPWFTERAGRDLWRLSVPQTAPVLDVPEPPLIEWHGAQRWVAGDRADADALRRVAAAAGGHATLFRAAGAQDVPRFAPPQPPLDRIQRELKQQFDPAGIFNRGRLFPGF